MTALQGAQRYVSTRLLATRQGTIIVGAAAALLAGLILLAYLGQYRSSVSSGAEPVTVLVARSLIERGTPGTSVAVNELFEIARTPRDNAKEGALTDPSALRGQIAATDIYPGQQLSAADFHAAATSGLAGDLVAKQRAIAVPIDSAHGLIGRVAAGDRVDIYAGFEVTQLGGNHPVLKLLMQDVRVLEAPEAAGGGVGGKDAKEIVVRVNTNQAAQLAFASEYGKVWVVLRPRDGGKPVKPRLVTIESLLFGVKPITVRR